MTDIKKFIKIKKYYKLIQKTFQVDIRVQNIKEKSNQLIKPRKGAKDYMDF